MYQLIQTQRSFNQIWLVECKTKRHNKNYFLVSVALHLGLILVLNSTKISKLGLNSLERSEAPPPNSLHPSVPLLWAPNASPIATSILQWTLLFDPTTCAMWPQERIGERTMVTVVLVLSTISNCRNPPGTFEASKTYSCQVRTAQQVNKHVWSLQGSEPCKIPI